MATKILSFFCLAFFFCFVHSDVFDGVLDDVSTCKEVCKNTYTPHTFDKSGSADCCDRGCRLFSMMEFIYDDKNRTTEVCLQSCGEAYPDKGDNDACQMGCKSQKPFFLNIKEDDMSPNMHLVNPVMYFHNWYSNILGNMMNQASVSWSVYMQDSDGSVIVVKSPPTFHQVKLNIADIADGLDEEYNTASYMETNIEPLDNSATPFLKDSQFNAQRNDDDIIDLSARDLDGYRNSNRDAAANDWLSCIANKTGVPRLLLSWLLLMCAIVMIWLCLSAAVTAPEQRIVSEPQKLSINGDQEVIAELLALGVKPSYPQTEEAGILPLKIKVQRI